MAIQRVVPSNELIDRIGQFEFLSKEPEPSFNFSIGLQVFLPGEDMIVVVQVKELLERMEGEIADPG